MRVGLESGKIRLLNRKLYSIWEIWCVQRKLATALPDIWQQYSQTKVLPAPLDNTIFFAQTKTTLTMFLFFAENVLHITLIGS